MIIKKSRLSSGQLPGPSQAQPNKILGHRDRSEEVLGRWRETFRAAGPRAELEEKQTPPEASRDERLYRTFLQKAASHL